MKTLSELKQELHYAEEGLAQMQEPEAGYFEDPKNKQPYELIAYGRDIKSQCDAIASLQQRIVSLEKYHAQFVGKA